MEQVITEWSRAAVHLSGAPGRFSDDWDAHSMTEWTPPEYTLVLFDPRSKHIVDGEVSAEVYTTWKRYHLEEIPPGEIPPGQYAGEVSLGSSNSTIVRCRSKIQLSMQKKSCHSHYKYHCWSVMLEIRIVNGEEESGVAELPRGSHRTWESDEDYYLESRNPQSLSIRLLRISSIKASGI